MKSNVIFKYSVIAVIIALCCTGGGLLIKNVAHYNNAINIYENAIAYDESFFELGLNDAQKEQLDKEIAIYKKQLAVYETLIKREIVAMVCCFTTVAVMVIYCGFEIITAIRRKRRSKKQK